MKLHYLIGLAGLLPSLAWAAHMIDGKPTWLGCNAASHECYLELDGVSNDSGCQSGGLWVWRMDQGTGEKIYNIAEHALLDDSFSLRVYYEGCTTAAINGLEYPILTTLWIRKAPHRNTDASSKQGADHED